MLHSPKPIIIEDPLVSEMLGKLEGKEQWAVFGAVERLRALITIYCESNSREPFTLACAQGLRRESQEFVGNLE